jgi:hypothetical protein
MSTQPSLSKSATLRAANSSSVMKPRPTRWNVPWFVTLVATANGRQRAHLKKAVVGQALTDGFRRPARHKPDPQIDTPPLTWHGPFPGYTSCPCSPGVSPCLVGEGPENVLTADHRHAAGHNPTLWTPGALMGVQVHMVRIVSYYAITYGICTVPSPAGAVICEEGVSTSRTRRHHTPGGCVLNISCNEREPALRLHPSGGWCSIPAQHTSSSSWPFAQMVLTVFATSDTILASARHRRGSETHHEVKYLRTCGCHVSNRTASWH